MADRLIISPLVAMWGPNVLVGMAGLWLAWRIHLKHLPPGAGMRRLDLGIRWVLLGGPRPPYAPTPANGALVTAILNPIRGPDCTPIGGPF